MVIPIVYYVVAAACLCDAAVGVNAFFDLREQRLMQARPLVRCEACGRVIRQHADDQVLCTGCEERRL